MNRLKRTKCRSAQRDAERGTVRTIRIFAKARELRLLKGPFGRQSVGGNEGSPAEGERKYAKRNRHGLSEENGQEKEACVSLVEREHRLLEMEKRAG